MGRLRGFLALLFLPHAVVAAGAAVAACVIADPPPELPKAPRHRPVILHASVVPPATLILSSLPSQFHVPVELLDDDPRFEWSVYVDGQKTAYLRRPEERAETDGGVIDIVFAPPTMSNFECHVIEFLIAHSFIADTRGAEPPGGDSIAWLYNRTGNPLGCPPYDGGSFDAAVLDAVSDAGPLPLPGD